MPLLIVVVILAILVVAFLYNPPTTEEPESSLATPITIDNAYAIFNKEDGTIDRFVWVEDTKTPTVEDVQVAVEADLRDGYSFDIETTIDFEGQPYQYLAFAILDDADFIWLYNTYFASSDFVPPELFAPQAVLMDQDETTIYASLQQALAAVPVTIVENEPIDQPTRDAIAAYYTEGKTAFETLALLGRESNSAVGYAFEFSNCDNRGFSPSANELLVNMEQALGNTLDWYGMYTSVPVPDSEVPCAVTNTTPDPSMYLENNDDLNGSVEEPTW